MEPVLDPVAAVCADDAATAPGPPAEGATARAPAAEADGRVAEDNATAAPAVADLQGSEAHAAAKADAGGVATEAAAPPAAAGPGEAAAVATATQDTAAAEPAGTGDGPRALDAASAPAPAAAEAPAAGATAAEGTPVAGLRAGRADQVGEGQAAVGDAAGAPAAAAPRAEAMEEEEEPGGIPVVADAYMLAEEEEDQGSATAPAVPTEATPAALASGTAAAAAGTAAATATDAVLPAPGGAITPTGTLAAAATSLATPTDAAGAAAPTAKADPAPVPAKATTPPANAVASPVPPKAAATPVGAFARGGSKAPIVVFDLEDTVDDIVPLVSYDEKRSHFTKDGRWIIPKREQFPSVFCALRVRVRIEKLNAEAGDERNPKALTAADVEGILRDDLGFGKSLVRWDDARDGAADLVAPAREVLAAINGDLPRGRESGSIVKADQRGVAAMIVDVTETCDDVDPARITALAQCFKESGDNDAIIFELPQLWIIADPDFRAKTASIGLYPGSFWMGFLKSWGHVVMSEVFFRTVQRESPEPMVHLVVKYRDRECLKMCYTFLHDRYLSHPKQEKELRQPWCRLTMFQEFKSKALSGTKPVKSTARSGAGPRSKGVGAPAKAPPAKASTAPAKPTTPATPSIKAASAAGQAVPAKPGPPAELAPMTPMPSVVHGAPIAAAGAKAPPETTPLADFEDVGALSRSAEPAEGSDRVLTPAEAMHGLTGKQLEAFQMAMSRMERLERENQELMQILLQMQGLLQQQQRRNARLTQLAGYSGAPAAEPAQATAQRQQWAQPGQQMGSGQPGQQPPVAQRLQDPVPAVAPAANAAGGMPGLPPPQLPPQQRPPATAQVPAAAALDSAPQVAVVRHGEKRKVAARSFAGGRLHAVAPKAGGSAPEGATGDGEGDEAPWKRQRRRPRRPPRTGAGGAKGDGTEAAEPAARGLAAYHDALLGV